MAERHRSQDGTRETEAFTDIEQMPAQSGRAQGRDARDVGTRDEEKQAVKGRGAAPVRKMDEEGKGGLGGDHGAGQGSS